MSAPEVSVIVVTYESGPVLTRCLSQLRAQTFRDFEVILSDNGSPDGAAQAAAKADPSLILLENGANLGFAQLAADDPAVLDGAGDAMTLIGLPYRMGWRKPRPDRVPAGEVFSPCGAAMLIARETFLEMGGFESRFFSYCEDVDLGYRLRLAGGRTRLVPDAVVHHVGSSTLGARSDFAIFHGFRNRLWTFARNTPSVLMPVAAPLHALATLLLLAGCIARGEGGPAWRGIRAALPKMVEMRLAQAGACRHVRHTIAAMTWSPLKTIRRARAGSPPGTSATPSSSTRKTSTL